MSKLTLRIGSKSDNPQISGSVQPGTSYTLRRSGNEVDVSLVIDTTGSMNDKINALLQTCSQLVDSCYQLNLKPNFSIISFGDLEVKGGGDRVEVVVPLTEDIERIKAGLRHMPSNSGFANEGESALEALDVALNMK